MDLLEVWAEWQPGAPPFVLDGDLEVLNSDRSRRAIVTHQTWEEASRASDFCVPGDRRLHLGLLPQPFFGDLRRASIYVLSLNPGLGPGDYFGEYEVPGYRAALLANLQQQRQDVAIPFLLLDPKFAWHGGFDWWHGKLAKLIQRLALNWRVSYSEARSRLAGRLASIELLPYHSAGFNDADGWLRKLRSVDLARSFVKDSVVPRVQRGEAIIIAMRKVAIWNLPELSGVVTYTRGQARGAHLAPNSPGGRAILKHLGCAA
jgi:hypothetical protein